MKTNIGNRAIATSHAGVEMGYKWGIMLHLSSLLYGSINKGFSCFAGIQMSHHSFYGTLRHLAE